MPHPTRRSFLKSLSIGASSVAVFGTTVVSSGIAHANGGSWNLSPGLFHHGVASGDPLSDCLILWTRVTPASENGWHAPRRLRVRFEVSTDPLFSHVIRQGHALARRGRDYTVKIDLVGLSPDTEYYYRFKTRNATSPTGRGKTLPVGDVSQVKLAVMSCSNFPAGYFNVYQDAANVPELDAVCHLGDYIYEYGVGGYATENADAIGRGFVPGNSTEIFSLRDYRRRYAQYRTDSGCQALHAAAPFICVWDDHEIANDAWMDGAENHNPGEGSFNKRKRRAIRAYFEWMPVRPPGPQFASEEIYRRFDFGNLLRLHMLDTRLIGRDEQLDFANYFQPDGSFDAASFTQDVGNPARTILGAEQLSWLQTGLATSSATWQVLGQQVLMGRMNIPVELIAGLANPGPQLFVTIQELAQIKARILAGDPTVTPLEQARVETVLPYNLDAWDGYAVEREVVFGTSLASDQNLVVLAGDTHNAWANNLTDLAGNRVGVEFATASVTSPGLEAFLGLDELTGPGAEAAIGLLIDQLDYLNLVDRGFMTVTFKQDEAIAEWTYLDNILSTNYQQIPARARKLRVLPGPGGRKLEELA